MPMTLAFLLLLLLLPATAPGQDAASRDATSSARVQRDRVGFAVSEADFQAVLQAALKAEGLDLPGDGSSTPPGVAVILPHDDYLYAGRTAVHGLAAMQARRWVVLGVCHVCRRMGVRDQLLFTADTRWQIAGRTFAVDTQLADLIMEGLGEEAAVLNDERHRSEHSIEALLPWLGAAVDQPLFVPILVPGMEMDRLEDLSARLGRVLADICLARDWQPGRDLGLLISADAVHYGCEGWGGNGYAPFGCDAEGHVQARRQDMSIARQQLGGPLTLAKIRTFTDLVWDRDHPDYPTYPYRVTWCGLYSIPFGLNTARCWTEALGCGPLEGRLQRYGDSLTDGRLPLEGTRLGVTAPNNENHWVGYVTQIYQEMTNEPKEDPR